MDYTKNENKLTVNQLKDVKILAELSTESRGSISKLIASSLKPLLDSNPKADPKHPIWNCVGSDSALLFDKTPVGFDEEDRKFRDLNHRSRYCDEMEIYTSKISPEISGLYVIEDQELKGKKVKVNPNERFGDFVYSAVLYYCATHQWEFTRYTKQPESFNFRGNVIRCSIWHRPMQRGWISRSCITISVSNGRLTGAGASDGDLRSCYCEELIRTESKTREAERTFEESFDEVEDFDDLEI